MQWSWHCSACILPAGVAASPLSGSGSADTLVVDAQAGNAVVAAAGTPVCSHVSTASKQAAHSRMRPTRGGQVPRNEIGG